MVRHLRRRHRQLVEGCWFETGLLQSFSFFPPLLFKPALLRPYKVVSRKGFFGELKAWRSEIVFSKVIV